MVQKFQGRSGGGHSAAPRPRPAAWSPAYAAPGVNTPRSDLASLGCVVVEMLAGQPPFAGLATAIGLGNPHAEDRVRAPQRPGGGRRPQGSGGFHRQLVKGGLASEHEHDIRAWLDQVG